MSLFALLIRYRSWSIVSGLAGCLLTLSVGPGAPLAPVLGGLAAGGVTSGAANNPAFLLTSSKVTVKGTGDFASLAVTVGQTRDLMNQTVAVTWTGARVTNDPAAFDVDYLQVMQCWGDDPNAADFRTHCQFGGTVGFDNRGGTNANSRKLTLNSYRDAAEPLLSGGQPAEGSFVPFTSVTGVTVTGQETYKNQFYDNTTTNEVPYARTRADGSGQLLFETQTYREAPGLGCADKLATGPDKGKPRGCWLVIVPRGDTEVDGTGRGAVVGNGTHRLDSSPLSATNWAHRLTVPLAFAPVGDVCPIATAQKPTVGVESVAEAMQRWQPALCANKGPVFSFATVADSVAARTAASDTPGMVFTNSPIGAPPEDRVYTYAPIALSGLTIGVQIERRTPDGGDAAEHLADGEPMTEVNLTPRLVAKLLTQSYTFSAPGLHTARYLERNPTTIGADPDFLAVNPAFARTRYVNEIEVLTPLGLSSATKLLWTWIDADQDANDFLAGLPDPWGMRVNPFYQGLAVPREDVPKIDPFCVKPKPETPQLCTLDEHPYAQDWHEGMRAAARGDQLSRTFWDPNAVPPAWKKVSLQLSGQRQVTALGDTATAARYGLVTARLRNTAGKFVAPTTAGLQAAAKAMQPSGTAGVLAPDPVTSDPAAYPLPLLTYAVNTPNLYSATDAAAYANLIRYAAGKGQVAGTAPGSLPVGYAPLPATLRSQALAAAATVAARVGPPRVRSPGGGGGAKGTGGGSAPGGAGSGTAVSGGGTPVTAPTPTPAPSVPPSAVLPGGSHPSTLTSTPTASADPALVGGIRYAVLVALVLGTLVAVLGPALPRLARRLEGRGATPVGSSHGQPSVSSPPPATPVGSGATSG